MKGLNTQRQIPDFLLIGIKSFVEVTVQTFRLLFNIETGIS